MKSSRDQYTSRECSADLVFASNHSAVHQIWSGHAKEIPNGKSESTRARLVDTGKDDTTTNNDEVQDIY